MRGSSFRNAQGYFSQASQVDPISPSPWQALAEIEFRKGEQNRSAFDQGVELKKAAIQRDPLNPRHYFDLGRQWEQQYQASHQQDDLKPALERRGLPVLMKVTKTDIKPTRGNPHYP